MSDVYMDDEPPQFTIGDEGQVPVSYSEEPEFNVDDEENDEVLEEEEVVHQFYPKSSRVKRSHRSQYHRGKKRKKKPKQNNIKRLFFKMKNNSKKLNTLFENMVKRRMKIIKYIFIIQLVVNVVGVLINSIVFILVNWWNVPIVLYIATVLEGIKLLLQIWEARDMYFWYISRRMYIEQHKFSKFGEGTILDKMSSISKMTKEQVLNKDDVEVLLNDMTTLSIQLRRKTYKDANDLLIKIFNRTRSYFYFSFFIQAIMLLCAYSMWQSLASCYTPIYMGIWCIFISIGTNSVLWIVCLVLVSGILINWIVMSLLLFIPISSTFRMEERGGGGGGEGNFGKSENHQKKDPNMANKMSGGSSMDREKVVIKIDEEEEEERKKKKNMDDDELFSLGDDDDDDDDRNTRQKQKQLQNQHEIKNVEKVGIPNYTMYPVVNND